MGLCRLPKYLAQQRIIYISVYIDKTLLDSHLTSYPEKAEIKTL